MVVADSTPFDDLHSILQSLNDSRAWVYAEWVCASMITSIGLTGLCLASTANIVAVHLQIGEEYTPKEDGVWIPSYHGILYNLTDDAIRGTFRVILSATPQRVHMSKMGRY